MHHPGRVTSGTSDLHGTPPHSVHSSGEHCLRINLAALLLLGCLAGVPMANASQVTGMKDAQVLKERLGRDYPSLLYVDRYRAAYPEEAQGSGPISSRKALPALSDTQSLVETLAQLQDQHVALVGPKAGKAETLGVLFRSSADGGLVAWRVFDRTAAKGAVRRGDQILAIDGVQARQWLERAASLTFGGNRRGRMAEAALDIGLGSPVAHKTAHLGSHVELLVRRGGRPARKVTLAYRPMDEKLATAMSAAIGERDLPERFDAGGLRVATMRIGAFAPQYDPVYLAASEAAAARPGSNDDKAMLAGYCAVVSRFVQGYDSLARDADVMVLDLRGNMGGFDREARLLADSLAGANLPRTFDFSATATPGTVKLVEEKIDPSCVRVSQKRPIVVLVDAGTRSAGEFMTAWLWAGGFPVLGETTMGAGGGYEFDRPSSFALPESGFSVRASAVFSVFDPVGALTPGERSEQSLVDQITGDHFRPSRTRPFAIQSVGFTPDMRLAPKRRDLQDGGLSQLKVAIAKLAMQGPLHRQ